MPLLAAMLGILAFALQLPASTFTSSSVTGTCHSLYDPQTTITVVGTALAVCPDGYVPLMMSAGASALDAPGSGSVSVRVGGFDYGSDNAGTSAAVANFEEEFTATGDGDATLHLHLDYSYREGDDGGAVFASFGAFYNGRQIYFLSLIDDHRLYRGSQDLFVPYTYGSTVMFGLSATADVFVNTAGAAQVQIDGTLTAEIVPEPRLTTPVGIILLILTLHRWRWSIVSGSRHS